MESNDLNLSHCERNRRRRQGKGNLLYVRYADDFIVLCNGRKAEALEIKEERKNVLDHMGLTLSEEKTQVTHIYSSAEMHWFESGSPLDIPCLHQHLE